MGARGVGGSDDMGRVKPVVWMVLGPALLTVLLVVVDRLNRTDAATIGRHEVRIQELQQADSAIRERIAGLEAEVRAGRKASEAALEILQRQGDERPGHSH